MSGQTVITPRAEEIAKSAGSPNVGNLANMEGGVSVVPKAASSVLRYLGAPGGSVEVYTPEVVLNPLLTPLEYEVTVWEGHGLAPHHEMSSRTQTINASGKVGETMESEQENESTLEKAWKIIRSRPGYRSEEDRAVESQRKSDRLLAAIDKLARFKEHRKP